MSYHSIKQFIEFQKLLNFQTIRNTKLLKCLVKQHSNPAKVYETATPRIGDFSYLVR